MIGTTLSHYRILEQLGAGAMGVVYRAQDERLRREVAVKVLPEGALADESRRRRFRQEALALSRLNHPGIATVHDFDRDAGADFLVMELVSGETLATRLAAGPLPVAEVTALGIQIAEAGAFRWKPGREAFPLAHAAAARALELDPDLAEGHTSLGFAIQYYDWDWDRADGAYRRAIMLQPGYAVAHQWYGDFLAALGRFEPAFGELQVAAELDPLSPVVATSHGDAYYYARRQEEAIDRFRHALELDAGYLWARLNLGRSQQELGRHDEAIRNFEAGLGGAGIPLDDSPALAQAWAAAGDRARAGTILARVIERWREGRVSPYSVANIHVALGDRDEAFAWLERAFEERDRMMVSLRVHPRLDPLRDDPRFAGLLRRMGLTA